MKAGTYHDHNGHKGQDASCVILIKVPDIEKNKEDIAYGRRECMVIA